MRCKAYFDLLNSLGATRQCDRQAPKSVNNFRSRSSAVADVVGVLTLAGIASVAITLVEVQRRSGQSASPLYTD